MHPERFPNKRKSKLSPRGDGPFRVLERINDNAYHLELPGEFNISSSFNVADLSPFHVDEDDAPMMEHLQEGGNDEGIKPMESNRPMTRARARKLREQLGETVAEVLSKEEKASSPNRTKIDKSHIEVYSRSAKKKTRDSYQDQDQDIQDLQDIQEAEQEDQEPSRLELEATNKAWPFIRSNKVCFVFNINVFAGPSSPMAPAS
jgi:hypothetical protein